MAPVRFFTPEEARAVVPRLRPLLARVREAWHEHAFAREQVKELVEDFGEAVFRAGHPESAEALRWRAAMEESGSRLEALLREVEALGAELKDPALGLVDFYARRGEEVVYLCYRDDEADLAHWHPLTTGFAGRRPLTEF